MGTRTSSGMEGVFGLVIIPLSAASGVADGVLSGVELTCASTEEVEVRGVDPVDVEEASFTAASASSSSDARISIATLP